MQLIIKQFSDLPIYLTKVLTIKSVKKMHVVFIPLLLFIGLQQAYGSVGIKILTLDYIIDTLSLYTKDAEIEKIKYYSQLLQYQNYRKSFLPSFSFTLSPINLNRSLRLLQKAEDGSYYYIDDYSNTSNAGLAMRQKIGFTGGEFTIGSDLNYLHEYSSKRRTFSVTPFYIGYSQQLWGGLKQYKLEKKVQSAQNDIAVKEYLSSIATIQQGVLDLYLQAFILKIGVDLTKKIKESGDTLLEVARMKHKHGYITEYDFGQIELQQVNTCFEYEKRTKDFILAYQRLTTYLQTSDSIDLSLPDADVFRGITIDELKYYIKKNNPFYHRQIIQKLQAEQTLHQAKLSNSWNAHIRVDYGLNQYASTLSEAYRKQNVRQSIGIGLQIPIFQWGVRKNKISIAINNYQIQCKQIEKERENFEMKLLEKHSIHNSSIRQLDLTTKTFQLSKEQYAMAVSKFTLGAISAFELNSHLANLNVTMQQYVQAVQSMLLSEYELRTLALYDFRKQVELEEIIIDNQ